MAFLDELHKIKDFAHLDPTIIAGPEKYVHACAAGWIVACMLARAQPVWSA